MNDQSKFAADHEAWRLTRMAKLTDPRGWLNLVGRWPMTVGTYSVGAAQDNDICLADAPDHLGKITLHSDSSGTFSPADGGDVLTFAGTGNPECQIGRFLMEITKTGGQHALRVRDTQSEALKTTKRLASFPLDPALRITARWEKLETPLTLTVDTIAGLLIKATATHVAHFEVGGEQVSMIATSGTADRPQFVFRDMTSLDDAYEKSRFVFGEEVTDDSVVIDFNRAVNPPCAFTPYAVCPLPPRENLISVRIEAGETRLK